MLKSTKFSFLLVVACAVMSTALEYTVLPTPLSFGIVNEDLAGDIRLVHEHGDTLNHKVYIDTLTIQRQYDFHVSIVRNDEPICSGAIVSGGQHVVTAASCNVKNTDLVRINASRRYFGRILEITCVKNHPNYGNSTHRFDYDIAVIRLNEIAPQTALVPNSPAYIPKEGSVTFYSILSGLLFKHALIVADVPIISAAACRKLGFNLTDNMLCAGYYVPNTSFCSEDRGSPLFAHGMLIGVKSVGERCSRAMLPSVYTNSSVVQRWIEDTIRAPNC